MLLRASGKRTGDTYDVRGLTSRDGPSAGVAAEDLLRAFVDAAIRNDEPALATARDALADELGPAALVDAAAVIGNFECMNRVADGCGIAVDEMLAKMAGDVANILDIGHYASARNTPPGRL